MDYVSDLYISTAITKISGYLKLSEVLAGATLIAFSNETTDLVTVIVASVNTVKEGDDLAIGDLMGASIYAMTVILAYIVFQSKSKTVKNVIVYYFFEIFN